MLQAKKSTAKEILQQLQTAKKNTYDIKHEEIKPVGLQSIQRKIRFLVPSCSKAYLCWL